MESLQQRTPQRGLDRGCGADSRALEESIAELARILVGFRCDPDPSQVARELDAAVRVLGTARRTALDTGVVGFEPLAGMLEKILLELTRNPSNPDGDLSESLLRGIRGLEAAVRDEPQQVDLEVLKQQLRSLQATADLDGPTHALPAPESAAGISLAELSSTWEPIAAEAGRRAGRRVRLMLRVDDLELDRRVESKLRGAVHHLLQDAATHGIETPEDRRTLGKDPVGTIWVQAIERESDLEILVMDDGRPLDFAHIRAKARELGILAPGKPHKISTEQIESIVFDPSFSAERPRGAPRVRGAGMRLLKRRLAEFGGSAEIALPQSGVGAGFRIRLPLRPGADEATSPAAAIDPGSADAQR